jgi:hypothetical protein
MEMNKAAFQKNKRTFSVSLPLVFILIGGAFVLVIGFMFFSQYNFMKTAKTSTGIVVDYVIPKGRRIPQPVFEFTAEDKKTYVYHHPEGTNPPAYHIGQEVVLYYDPADPEDVSVGYRVVPMIILGFVGVVLLIIGLAFRK